MTDDAIVVEGLEKSYGSVRALNGIDFAARTGSVLGLLGPNGAGKTTAVRILTTLLEADAGTARVAGLDVKRDAAELRAKIGLAGQYAAVDENLTGFENLEMVGRLYHLGKSASRERAGELLERVRADGGRQAAGQDLLRRHAAPARPRGGARRPPAGPVPGRADHRARPAQPDRHVGDDRGPRAAAGATVLLTTQYLDEADRLADRIVVIDHGRVIAEGTSRRAQGPDRRRAARHQARGPGRREAAIAALAEMCLDRATAEDGVVHAPVRPRHGVIPEAVRKLDAAGVGIDDISLHRPTLDDVFIALTGHAAEDTTGEPEEEKEAAAA